MRHLPINYPGLEAYSITEEGEVIGKDGVSKLSQFKSVRGYMQVGLYIRGDTKRKYSIHRLVALTYVPNPDNKPQVDHIDGNKLNNHHTNLRWVTGSENVAKAFKQGRVGSRKGKLSGRLTGLYLTHEALAVLDTVSNKSKYVSELIVKGTKTGTPTENTPPAQKIDIPDPVEVSDLFNEQPDDGEMACCQANKPCKHWVWDLTSGEGYINSLSGRFRSVDGSQ